MLKNISNLGKTLNKVEQKAINGGKSSINAEPDGGRCSIVFMCPIGQICRYIIDDVIGVCEYA